MLANQAVQPLEEMLVSYRSLASSGRRALNVAQFSTKKRP